MRVVKKPICTANNASQKEIEMDGGELETKHCGSYTPIGKPK